MVWLLIYPIVKQVFYTDSFLKRQPKGYKSILLI